MKTVLSFDSLREGEFFRFPGEVELYRKLAHRYEGTKEVNYQTGNGEFGYMNSLQFVVKVSPDDPIPTVQELRAEK